MSLINELVYSYYKSIKEDQYARYKSWEYCFEAFQKHKSVTNDECIDNLSLHLGMYLASWGMYRGSTQLLQRNYKVHSSVVRELLDSKYISLWDLDFSKTSADQIDLVFHLAKNIEGKYKQAMGQSVNVTETLVTKVILGTIGCVPAYDRFFQNGLKKHRITQLFGKKSIEQVIGFYKENKDEFDKVQLEIKKDGLHYPIMKLIDMYFWEIGYEKDKVKASE